ncbi:integrase core domain-containing protein [Desulfosoma sp.]|uniref:integrase core domain-containing protein n=1 Tax=Desulfosoma sp. TaxID=2603217 RepID=UPI00404AD929
MCPESLSPYSPEQNGGIERFMRTLKEECLWLPLFSSFAEAQAIIETGIQAYNTERSHHELGYVSSVESPYEHAAQSP